MSELRFIPAFAEAAALFRDYLEEQGWPTELVWARAGDVELKAPVTIYRGLDTDEDVEREYEAGRGRGSRLELRAICTVGEVTCATVVETRGSGLWFTVAETRVEGQIRWPLC
jgi:hypothetical protein